MTRIKLIVYSVFLPLMAAMGGNVAEARKPSIVFIVADDLGYGELGCYHGPDAKTPHLDGLANEGVRCTSTSRETAGAARKAE